MPVRLICNYLGLSWSGQRERINRDPVLSDVMRFVCVTVQTLEQLVRWQEANEEAGNVRLVQYIKQLLKVKEPRQVDLSPDPVRLGQTFRKRASTAMKVFKGLGNGTMLQIAVALSDDEVAQDELIALEQRIAEMR